MSPRSKSLENSGEDSEAMASNSTSTAATSRSLRGVWAPAP